MGLRKDKNALIFTVCGLCGRRTGPAAATQRLRRSEGCCRGDDTRACEGYGGGAWAAATRVLARAAGGDARGRAGCGWGRRVRGLQGRGQREAAARGGGGGGTRGLRGRRRRGCSDGSVAEATPGGYGESTVVGKMENTKIQ
ncbi:hypothetical protein GUJ93_ZPchr0007g6253 [Zizania palustris]|uniref:Uncharacterized protein n=1 Tax=Zizania palustris TaxID=103762 RepID=A0A8J5W500_ZIZPA|nr:hypothetical protein GUJ93_ZPchr0007g6253 [Zizania palustris]